MNLVLVDAGNLHHGRKRYGKKAATDAKKQSLDARKRQRSEKLNGCAAALVGRDVHRALQAVQHSADDVHTHAAPGNLGHLGGGAKTRLENQVESFGVRKALSFVSFQNSFFHGQRANLREVDAPAVIAYLDYHLRALVISVQINRAASGLAGGDALFGMLHAVIDGVSNQVHKWFGERVENALVEVGILPGDFQRDVL